MSNAAGSAVPVALYVTMYLVPSIVAVIRRSKTNMGSVIVVDVFLGWTVIGWIVALAMACKSRTTVRIES